jgi:hypothetical protein
VRHSLTSGGAASSTRGERQAHGQEAARGVEGGGLEVGPSLHQVYHSGGGMPDGNAGQEHARHHEEDMQRAGGEKKKKKKL